MLDWQQVAQLAKELEEKSNLLADIVGEADAQVRGNSTRHRRARQLLIIQHNLFDVWKDLEDLAILEGDKNE